MNFLLVKELSTHTNYSITALTNYSMKIRITGGVKIYLDKVTLCWVDGNQRMSRMLLVVCYTLYNLHFFLILC